MKKVLFTDAEYVIEHEYELAYLRWPGGTYPLGEHYGDPTCAVMSIAGGWCVTGGEGLVITIFEGGLPHGNERVAASKVRQAALWRPDGASPPPPAGVVRYIFGLSLVSADRIRVVVDGGGGRDAFYEVDVRELSWQQV